MTNQLSHRPADRATALALVHHGHQHLITDGYDNHEGLSEVLDSFGAVLALHLRYRVPVNLHLSGTLLEAAAWHAAEFFGWVRALRDEGLVEVLGSAWSQPVMTLFSPEHNRRQMAEELDLLGRHLDVATAEVTGFWVPERVWDTAALAPVVTDPTLANGGYRYVLLDDRLAYSAAERPAFDRHSAPGRSPLPASAAGPPPDVATGGDASPESRRYAPGMELAGSGDSSAGTSPPHLRPWRVAGAGGLVAIPISGDLRYAIPPRDMAAWRLLFDTLAAVRAAGPGALALYADDLEKTAAVGPWTNGTWRRADVDAYEGLLRWLSTTAEVDTVLLSPWLAAHPPADARAVEQGTFYELAAGGAGDDYQRWWASAPYAPYRAHLEDLEATLAAGPPTGARSSPSRNGSGAGRHPAERLWELAWTQLMAAAYETAWHGLGANPDEPAPWARATASHARAAFHTVAAARFAAAGEQRHRETNGSPRVWVSDLDDDGHDEVVLANDRLFTVLSPRYGGRLVALYDLHAGALVVGNPADDWNWQEDVNRYMEVPANHPGALADVGHENERWEVAATRVLAGGSVEAELRHVEAGSPLEGSVKRVRLGAGEDHLDVAYELTQAPERFRVELGLSPDYLVLLRDGRQAVTAIGDGRRRGFAAGSAEVWVELPAGQPLVWEPPPARPAGHVLVLRAAAYRPSFRLRLGVGAPARPTEIDLGVNAAARPAEIDLRTAPSLRWGAPA